MAIRTLDQIISDAVAFIQSKIPALSLLTGTVARDVVVESPAQEFSKVYVEVDRVQRQQLLTDDTAYEDDELDGLAESVGLSRTLGIQATGTVIFRLATFDTSSDDVTVPLGTQVATAAAISGSTTSTVVSFVTTAERTFVAANASTFFNSTTNFFELTVPIQAVEEGIASNVGIGTITVLTSAVPQNPSVTNIIATAGGTAAETNSSLLARIRTKLAGTNVGTANGIISIITADPNVFDSLLVRPGDPELIRDQFGNAADVLIVGELLEQIAEVRTFTAGITDYTLSRQPLAGADEDSINTIITGIVGGGSFDFIKDTHFNVIVDRNSITKNSTNALTKIVFLGGPFPDSGSSFTVTYSINSLVESLQTTINSDDNKIVGTDILIREADKVLTRVGAAITVFPGFTQADVALAAANNVSTLLSTRTLDTNVDNSDIITEIQTTPGVDSVNTTTLTLEERRPGATSFSTVTNVIIGKTEYARPDTDPGGITIT